MLGINITNATMYILRFRYWCCLLTSTFPKFVFKCTMHIWFLFQIIYSIDILSPDLILLKQIRNINRYILVHVFKARHWFTMYYELTTSIFDLKETCMISIWAMIIQSINKWSINLKNYFSNLKTSLYTNHIERLQGGLFWREWR